MNNTLLIQFFPSVSSDTDYNVDPTQVNKMHYKYELDLNISTDAGIVIEKLQDCVFPFSYLIHIVLK